MAQIDPPAIATRIRQAITRLGLTSERELARRAGLASESHVNAILKRLDAGNRNLDLETALKLAVAIGRSLTYLATGREEASGVLLRDVHGWADAEVEARRRYPEIPDFAITAIGSMRVPGAEQIDAVAIRDLARTWFDMAGEAARRRSERQHVLGG